MVFGRSGIQKYGIMTKVVFEIENCSKCPFVDIIKVYTGDSWDDVHKWLCAKSDNKQIYGYVEWNNTKRCVVPDWCPILIKEPMNDKMCLCNTKTFHGECIICGKKHN